MFELSVVLNPGSGLRSRSGIRSRSGAKSDEIFQSRGHSRALPCQLKTQIFTSFTPKGDDEVGTQRASPSRRGLCALLGETRGDALNG